MCDEWKTSYITFKEWALKNGYNDNLTIDRIDVNGNYQPSNCRWATYTEQANNTRSTAFFTANGKTLPVSEWENIVNLKRGTILARRRRGWNDYDCLYVPLKK